MSENERRKGTTEKNNKEATKRRQITIKRQQETKREPK